jgi:hypothetical protein
MSYSNKDIQIEITHIPLDPFAPQYSLHIDGEGNVKYNVINNVKTKGIQHYKISKEKVQEIFDGLEEIYFFSLRDNYLSSSSKNSKEKIIITAKFDDKFKKIEFETDSKAPISLLMLVKKIDEITNITKLIENKHLKNNYYSN